ncbi:MAG: nucleotidyltransferase domain-containing protein [Candidatus Nezhaarchaeota archaeon]|nr:nucleotidyltransferase domain-containing protein [Candidatus Nezhaarchaeota archaeon]
MYAVANRIPMDLLLLLKEFAERARGFLSDVEVYLFGSYARGNWLSDSDVDLIVVSDGFRGLDPGQRYVLVRKLLPPNKGFEILTYTREEFEDAKKRSIVIQDAAEYWVRIT